MTRCPSDLELELIVRRGGGEAHLLACARCAARVAELRRLGDEFEREVFPATVEEVVAASRRRGTRPLLWIAPLAMAAAAAALALVLLHPPGDDDDAGGSVTLVAYRAAAGGGRPVADGEVLPAGAGLRFEVTPTRACNLWIVSRDAAGRISRIYPSTGADGVKVQAGKPVSVPGESALDGRTGPERFFAICGCGDEPVRYPDVHRALSAIGPGEGSVRAARVLPALPRDALQATVLVEKEQEEK